MKRRWRFVFHWPIRIMRYWPDRDPRRAYTHTQQVQVLERQEFKCPDCPGVLNLRTVRFHHVIPWHEGGKTIISNCVALCPNCHATRTFRHSLGDAERSRSAPGGGEQ